MFRKLAKFKKINSIKRIGNLKNLIKNSWKKIFANNKKHNNNNQNIAISNSKRKHLKNTFLAPVVLLFAVKNLSSNGNSNLAIAAEKYNILAVRIWPAEDYTRITIESNKKLSYNQFMLSNPDRLVVDVDDVYFDKVLKNMRNQIKHNDPYIKVLRAGQFTPTTVRIVIDLKQKIKPQLFTLQPIENYKHRLVIDIYSLKSEKVYAEKNNSSSNKNKSAAVKTSKKSGRKLIVTLDPGHGGEDPGAIGAMGTKEKNVTLQIAKKLQTMLTKQNIKCFLTRDSDYFIPLGTRVTKSRKNNSDLFLSIHADAWTKPEAKGSSVFILSEKGASSTLAKLMAKKENQADIIGGLNINTNGDKFLTQTLLDLSQTGTINESNKVANYLLNGLKSINTLHKNNVEKAGFAVLKAPDIPSVLIETAFISNPLEEKNLRNASFQEKLAKVMMNASIKYLKNIKV